MPFCFLFVLNRDISVCTADLHSGVGKASAQCISSTRLQSTVNSVGCLRCHCYKCFRSRRPIFWCCFL